MKRMIAVLSSVILVLLLAACGGTDTEGDNTTADSASSTNGDTASTEGISLVEDYEDALATDGQLALGSLKLDDDLAVDEEQALELLPLWQG